MARKQTQKAVKRKRVRKTASEVELRKLKLSAVLSERFPPDRVADEVERLLTATAKKFNHLGKVIDESRTSPRSRKESSLSCTTPRGFR